MIVVLSAGLSTPMMLKQSLKSYTNFCGMFCTEEWGEDDTGRRIYGTVMVGLQFVLPLLIITFCYTTISIRLGQSLILKNQNKHTPMSAQRLSACRRRQRTNRMLIAMVVAFAASWISNITFNVLRDFGQLPRWAKSQEYLFGIATHSIAMTSTVWNPLLYAWLNLQLRAAFLELVPERFRSRRRQEGANDPAGCQSPPVQLNGRASPMSPDDVTRDCNATWKRLNTLQQSESGLRLSDSIRASTA
uniref:G-protein coupled receptors family 1 profile domain-containing protein n=1 Tax=Plectus sambesii TaxID=2011161 RepID=A0A914V5Z4_9BILA